MADRPEPTSARAIGSVLVAALVSAAGAVVLGEYDLRGFTPVYSGAVFGLVVAEVVVLVGKRPSSETAAAAGFLAFGGMVWALVISTARDLSYASATSWIGVVLAAVVAVVWVRSAAGRATRTTPAPPPPAPGDRAPD